MGQRLHVGMPTVIEAYADRSPYAAVFEDDGDYAYFYGLDTRLEQQPVVDFVYVYCVTEVPERYRPRDVEIVWSPDQQRVALVIDGYAHAAFDFAGKRTYCRTNVPTRSTWSSAGHAWDDAAVDFLNPPSAEASASQ